MDPTLFKEHHQEGEYSHGQWMEVQQSYHAPPLPSPAHEYSGFNFASPAHAIPMEPSFIRPVHSLYSSTQPLPSLYTTQWPSMLTNPSTTQVPSMMPVPALAPLPSFVQAPLALPPLSTPAPVASTPTARRTLTDHDRRRMCQYHEDNPNIKQTEIGAMFGVERSTVSKVLRQKDKYLFPEDGSRSPIKRSKGKFPDIERALSNWAKNHQRQGLFLNDGVIREKARFFASTVGNNDSHVKVNSTSWLEKFKQKNGLMGAKSRRASEANDSDPADSQSGSQTPNGISPISPTTLVSPSSLSPSRSRDNIKNESPDSYMECSYKHAHSQSATSLASCFTDTTAPTSFSGGPQSPGSPFYSPDVVCGANPFISSHHLRVMSLPICANSMRPRSQTFPMLGLEPNYNGTSTGEAMTAKRMEELMSAPTLETPVDEISVSPLTMGPELRQLSHLTTGAPTPPLSHDPMDMPPPPPPLSASSSTLSSPIGPPSQYEARRALELVMNFFQTQPNKGLVDPQEYVVIGKLMEKLKMQLGEMPGGMHSIDIEGQRDMSRQRSIHSL